MTFWLRLWGWLKRVPGGLKWAAVAFFAGLVMAARYMGTRHKVAGIKARAKREREVLETAREDLKDAKESGEAAQVRAELLRNLRKES